MNVSQVVFALPVNPWTNKTADVTPCRQRRTSTSGDTLVFAILTFNGVRICSARRIVRQMNF